VSPTWSAKISSFFARARSVRLLYTRCDTELAWSAMFGKRGTVQSQATAMMVTVQMPTSA
jgi:hypothetical protein